MRSALNVSYEPYILPSVTEESDVRSLVESIMSSYGSRLFRTGFPVTVASDGSVSARSLNQIVRFPVGQIINERDAVAVATTTGTVISSINLSTTTTGNYNVGDTSASSKRSQAFTGSGITVNQVLLYMVKQGSPTDDIKVTIQTNNSGSPSGTVLASSVVNSASITDSSDNYFTFANPLSVASATTYHVVIERSSSVDASNYWKVGMDSTNPIAATDSKYWDGAVWNTETNTDLYSKIINGTVAGKAFQADSDVAALTNGYVGQAYATSNNSNVDVLISGTQNGYSGLTVGSIYYVNATPGSIGTSAGGTSKKIGIAVATDTIYIIPTI